MKGEIRKVETNHNRVRTDSMVGEFQNIPEVGKQFIIVGDALCPAVKAAGGGRVISTSLIQKVDYDSARRIFKFKTLNSVYELVLL